jgi:hypothetical protein
MLSKEEQQMTHYVREDYVFDHKPVSQLVPGDIFLGGTYGFSETLLEIRQEDDGNGYFLKVQERVYPHKISEWRHVPDGTYTVYPRRDIIVQMDGEVVTARERHQIIWIYFTNQGWYQGIILGEAGQEQVVRFHKASRTWYLASVSYPPAERQIDIQIAVAGVQPLKPGEVYTYPPRAISKEDLLTKLLPFIGSPLSRVGSFGEKDTWMIEEVYDREDSLCIFAKIVPPSPQISKIAPAS